MDCSGLPGSVALLRRRGRSAAVAVVSSAVLRAIGGLWGCANFRPAVVAVFHYNVRYGVQLLPAFAVSSLGSLFWCIRMRFAASKLRGSTGDSAVVDLRVGDRSYASIWHATPVWLREAQVNMRARAALESQLGTGCETSRRIPRCSCIWATTSARCSRQEFRCAPSTKAIIAPGNSPMIRMACGSGLWRIPRLRRLCRWLRRRQVWKAVRGRHLTALVEIHTTGQARAVIFYRINWPAIIRTR